MKTTSDTIFTEIHSLLPLVEKIRALVMAETSPRADGPGDREKANFHQACIDVVNAASGFQLLCHSRILYGNAEKTIGAVCRVADERYDSEGGFYFFTLRQTDFDYLRPFEKRYVVLGCGSSAQTLQILDRTFESWRGRRLNIYVRNKNGRYILHPKGRDERIDVTDTLIEADSGDRG